MSKAHRPVLWAVRTGLLVELFTAPPYRNEFGWYSDGERLGDFRLGDFERYFGLSLPDGMPAKVRLGARIAINR